MSKFVMIIGPEAVRENDGWARTCQIDWLEIYAQSPDD